MKAESNSLMIALVSEIFSAEDVLTSYLQNAQTQGAKLAVLPELPLNEWSPAKKFSKAEDAELPGGWRETMLRNAAQKAGIAVLGGVIRQRDDGSRINLALLINAKGAIIGTSSKHVLPNEEGFWECDHYEASTDPPKVLEYMGTKLGVQICSDANRSTAAQLLAAQGVQVILAPRATSVTSWGRWRLAYQAMALTSSAWVISVGRPRPEFGVTIGGPSLIVNPMGEIVLESEQSTVIHSLNLREVMHARHAYPGYLAWPAKMYIAGWQEILKNQS